MRNPVRRTATMRQRALWRQRGIGTGRGRHAGGHHPDRPRQATQWRSKTMLRVERFAIENIYVPVKRRATLKPRTVQEIAQSMLEVGQTTPIRVRRDGERFVLVEGLHRLEACKALGEETILGYLVQAPKH
jgi:sulfiredoxin